MKTSIIAVHALLAIVLSTLPDAGPARSAKGGARLVSPSPSLAFRDAAWPYVTSERDAHRAGRPVRVLRVELER